MAILPDGVSPLMTLFPESDMYIVSCVVIKMSEGLSNAAFVPVPSLLPDANPARVVTTPNQQEKI